MLSNSINSDWTGYTAQQQLDARWNKRIAAVDCGAIIINAPRLDTQSNTMTINGTGGPIIMGCELDPGVYSQPSWTTGTHKCEHGLRVFAAYEGFVAHNYIHNPLASKVHIKFQAVTNGSGTAVPYIDDWHDFLNDCLTATTGRKGIASRYCVFHANKLGGGADDVAAWSIEVGPQNTTEMELVRDTIIEFSTHEGHVGSTARDVVVRAAQDIIVRGITDSTTPAIVFGSSAHVHANMWPTYNGPYYTDEGSSEYTDGEGGEVTEIAAFADPGKPTGAA